jgi:hypothetical protein
VSKPNPFRLAREAITPPVLDELMRQDRALAGPPPQAVPAPRRERKPQVDLETIRVLLYLSTSPRLTRAHRDACRQAAELLR